MVKTSKEQADVQFKKAQRAQEGEKAMAQYLADGNATREKTLRLKALRLAKEAADMEVAAQVAATKKKPAAAKKKAVAAAKAPTEPA